MGSRVVWEVIQNGKAELILADWEENFDTLKLYFPDHESIKKIGPIKHILPSRHTGAEE